MLKILNRPRDEKMVVMPQDIIEIIRVDEDNQSVNVSEWRDRVPDIYECANCSLPIFDSFHRIDSGSRQPSFWQPIHQTCVSMQNDDTLGMNLTLVECTRCGAHLGYVFDDGPPPTGLRYSLTRAAWVVI